MIGLPTRLLGLTGILFMYLWPRYFYINIVGKGISGFTLFTMMLLAVSLFLPFYSIPLRRAVFASVRRSAPVFLVFVTWWLWRVACDAMGEAPAFSYGATFLDFLYLGCWTIIGTVLFTDSRFRAAFPYVVAVSGVVATVLGLLELQTRTPLSTLLGFANFEAGDQYSLAQIGSIITRGDVVRARSLFTHPLVYGQVMASMTPVAIYFVLHKRGVGKLLGLVLAACILTSVTISNARSPFLVAAAAAAVYFMLFYLDPRNGRRLFVLLWMALGLLIIIPTATGVLVQVASGRTSEEAISSVARDRQLSMGKAALVYRPINGYGDGNAGNHAGIPGEKHLFTIDNYYITSAVDSGYLGVSLFILLLLTSVVQGVVLCLRIPDTTTRGLACIAVATVVALAMGLTILSIVDSLSYIFLMIGCLAAVGGTVSRELLASRTRSRMLGERGRSLAAASPSRTALSR